MSTVIKVDTSGPLLKRLSTVDLADHLAEARAVVDEAERRAARIVAEAKVQAAGLLEQARKSGYAAGYEKGNAEGTRAGHQAAYTESIRRFDQEQAHVVADMRRVVTEIDALKEDLMLAAERGLLDFAVLVATRLTFEIGRLHRDTVVENLKRALRLVESKTHLTVRVHSADLASLETFADSVLKQLGASPVVNIVTDDSLAPGGCAVEGDRTSVDATLETQVKEIVSLLLGEGANDA